MSWLSDNYEKAALGGAAVVALALGAFIFKNKGEIADAFDVGSPKRNQETGVPGLPDITIAKNSFGKVHEVVRRDIDGRKVDLFAGVPLFAKKNDLDDPVDLLKSGPVHAGVDNDWWLKYGIDPGFSDSPERDPDKDGFTNREEYDAGAHPMDFNNHPDPVIKLVVMPKNGVKTTQVHIKPTDYGNGSVFKLETKGGRRVNKMGPKPVKAGEKIPFIEPLMKDRFMFAAMEKKQNPNGITDTIWVIEDLKPNKLGVKYRFDKRGNMVGFAKRQVGIMDSTVEFTLQALNQGGNPFKIEENTRFSLPFDPKADKKPYLLKKVDLDNKTVNVEYKLKDGTLKLKTINYK